MENVRCGAHVAYKPIDVAYELKMWHRTVVYVPFGRLTLQRPGDPKKVHGASVDKTNGFLACLHA